MNLNNIVSRSIGAVNPIITVSIQRSCGPVTNPDGTRSPGFEPPVKMRAQVQSLVYNDLSQIEGLNIQGTKKAVYLSGNWNGVVREDNKGGDLITFPDGSIWLCVQVLEDLGDKEGWVKIAITRQNGS